MPINSSTSTTLTLTGYYNGSIVTQTFQIWDEDTNWEFNREGNADYAERTILLNWSDSAMFITIIRGGGYYISGSYTYVSSDVFVNAPFLVFDKIKCTGVPIDGLMYDANNVVSYKFARAVITYKAIQYPEGADAAVMRVQYGLEIRTIPNTTGSPIYKFSDNTKCLVPFTYRVPTADITVTLFNCGQIPSATFQPLFNNVNNASYTITAVTSGGTPSGGSFTGATGTLLLAGTSTQERILTTGAYNFDVTYAFKWRYYPWNQELVTDPSSTSFGQWLAITRISDGATLYTASSFSSLLTAT